MESVPLSVVMAAFGGLAAAIGALWRVFYKRAEATEQRLCKTQDQLLGMTREIGELSGKVQIAENLSPAIQEIQNVTEDMLREIQRANDKDE